MGAFVAERDAGDRARTGSYSTVGPLSATVCVPEQAPAPRSLPALTLRLTTSPRCPRPARLMRPASRARQPASATPAAFPRFTPSKLALRRSLACPNTDARCLRLETPCNLTFDYSNAYRRPRAPQFLRAVQPRADSSVPEPDSRKDSRLPHDARGSWMPREGLACQSPRMRLCEPPALAPVLMLTFYAQERHPIAFSDRPNNGKARPRARSRAFCTSQNPSS